MRTKYTNLMNVDFRNDSGKLDEIIRGYQAFQVLNAAIETGLFDYLDNKLRDDSNSIAGSLKINGMLVKSFLQSLVDMGVLVLNNGLYENTAIATQFLVKSSENYQGNFIASYGGQGSVWTDIKTVLNATDMQEAKPDLDNGSEYLDAQLQRSLRGELQSVTRAIEEWEGFRDVRRILDLGGSHGLYTIALCQANPDILAVVLDNPQVIDITREYIRQFSMEDRIITWGGDVMNDELGAGFNVIIISHLLYQYRNDPASIFSKASRCLAPGGLLVLNHWFCSPGCGILPGGLKELDKSLNSSGHPLCHPEEFGKALESNGFKIINVAGVPSAYGNSVLHLAVKTMLNPSPLIEDKCGECSR